MIDAYIVGVTTQLERRVRELKLQIPRELPRDYDTLAQKCRDRLSAVTTQLKSLRNPEFARPENQPERIRRLKRAVSDLDILETAGIAALSRARADDHQLNILLERIAREIRYPLVTPVVTTLSQQYFHIYPDLNLLCVPLIEGRFLLHLPDLYHELAHPLLAVRDEPQVEPFQKALDRALRETLTYLQGERAKASRRNGPASFGYMIDLWESMWVRSWLVEFFCDLFAVVTLGPAFAWSHLHLATMRGGNPFEVPTARWASHPADAARMSTMLLALDEAGYTAAATEIRSKWEECVTHFGFTAEPEYQRCYPDALLRSLVREAELGIEQMSCRVATPACADLVHQALNGAWAEFWKSPAGYASWEVGAVQGLCTPSAPVVTTTIRAQAPAPML